MKRRTRRKMNRLASACDLSCNAPGRISYLDNIAPRPRRAAGHVRPTCAQAVTCARRAPDVRGTFDVRTCARIGN